MKRAGRIFAATALAVAAGCAAPNTRAAATISTPPAAADPTVTPVKTAKPMWQYSLPAGWDISGIRVNDATVIAAGRQAIFAFDAASGTLQWRANEGAAASAIGNDVIYGNDSGSVVARAIRSGSVRWRNPAVCHKPAYASPIGGVDVTIARGSDIFVACDGGAIVRIDAYTGRILSSSTAFNVQQVSEIHQLPGCGLGITGWSDGAILREHMIVLDCRDLHVIVPEREDTSVLGAVGDVAILNDTCCMGRPDVYRPATIVRVNLTTGRIAPEVDLTPEPNLYPADKRPVGQGAVAFLNGNRLYLAVDHAVYDYGDAVGSLGSYARLPVTLVEPPIPLEKGRLVVRTPTRDGSTVLSVALLQHGRLTPLRTWPDIGMPVAYHPQIAPDVILVASTGDAVHVFRPTDRAELYLPQRCLVQGSSAKMAVAVCTTNQLRGNRYLQYLAAFGWQAGLKE